MSTGVEPGDWMSLDPWWVEHTQTQPVGQGSALARVLNKGRLADCWEELDLWARSYAEASGDVRHPDVTRIIGTEWVADSWQELDSWWETFIETDHETAGEIAHLLDQSNREWGNSAAPFDTDPLASTLSQDRGPLLPSIEEEWSDWLAKLLRSSQELGAELFEVGVNQAPKKVVREDRLQREEGGFRRPDVITFHENHGISIEVKLDDENYGKTAETARLVETHYDDYKWTHVLLLPQGKKDRLESIVDQPVEQRASGQLQIEWDEPGPITVIHWRDVTQVVRSLLQRGETVDNQWAANAYLFCAAVEQRLLDFQPQPVIEQLADPVNVVDAIQPIALAGVLGEQLTYLESTVDQ